MNKAYRTCSKEFKLEALELLKTRDKSVAQMGGTWGSPRGNW